MQEDQQEQQQQKSTYTQQNIQEKKELKKMKEPLCLKVISQLLLEEKMKNRSQSMKLRQTT